MSGERMSAGDGPAGDGPAGDGPAEDGPIVRPTGTAAWGLWLEPVLGVPDQA